LALRVAGAKLGDDVYIGPTVYIQAPWLLQAGSRVSIHEFCLLACHGGVRIGSDVSIAHGSSILTTTHLYADPNVPIRDQAVEESPVELQDNVWIGCGTRILCGSTVESGVVVGANSVVRGNLPRDTICAGTPAEVKKTRTERNAS
jgi:acetyltransferase-like isoleucine patch superfamily enzyme